MRARTARNPRTGEAVKVKKTSVPAFRPGASFKELVATGKVPKATKAAAAGQEDRRRQGWKAVKATRPRRKAAPAKKAHRRPTTTKAAPRSTATVRPPAKKAPATPPRSAPSRSR